MPDTRYIEAGCAAMEPLDQALTMLCEARDANERIRKFKERLAERRAEMKPHGQRIWYQSLPDGRWQST